MLDRAAELFESTGTLGNTQCVRFLCTDVTDLKPYQGPFDAAVFNDVLATEHDPAASIRAATLLCRPGSTVVVSQRLDDPGTALPSMDVAEYIADLPLEAAAVAVDGKTMDGEGESPRLRRLPPLAPRTAAADRAGRSRCRRCTRCVIRWRCARPW